MKVSPFSLGATAALTFVLASCSAQQAPTPSTEPAQGIAGLPILEDRDSTRTDGIFFGIFRERSHRTGLPAEVATDLRFKPANVMWYTSWKDNSAFPKEEVLALSEQGVVPNITWEPWDWNLKVNDPGQITLTDVVNGKWDGYIREWARAAREVDVPFLLRWGHEFNGNWYPWAVANNGQDPALYVRAYRHVHDIFKAEGATKVQWIWCLNNADVPGESWNDPAKAYPGDAYVDWVGIDGYNWGTNPSWGSWTPFRDVFKTAYDKALLTAPGKPVILAEFASSEVGGDKGQWIQNMFTDLPRLFPQVRSIVWFDIQKEEDWRIGSTLGSKEKLVTGLRNKFMRGNGAAMLQVPASFKAPAPPAQGSRTLADFEQATTGRPTTATGGRVYLSGYQQDAAQPSTFSHQDQGPEAPALLLPAGNGQTGRAGFDFGIRAPNAYAGVVMTLDVQPRGSGGEVVAADLGGYRALRVTLAASGTRRVRLELLGDRGLGIADGSSPQVYVDVSTEARVIEVPLSSFVQPDWAPKKVALDEVMKRLASVNVVVDEVPSSGSVQVDDLALVR